MIVSTTVLLIFFVLVFYFDYKYLTIPNTLTIGMIVLSWLFAFTSGYNMLFDTVFHTLIGLLLLILPFMWGWVGGGDVKYVAAIASATTLSFTFQVLLVGLVLAGFLSALLLFQRGGFAALFGVFRLASVKNNPSSMFIPLGACFSVAGLFLIALQLIGG